MPSVRVVEESRASPEQVLEGARDFTPRRAELWRDVYTKHLTIHDRGETWADVTEGNPWGPWLVWERLRYDWSQLRRSSTVALLAELVLCLRLRRGKPGRTWDRKVPVSADR